MNKEELKQFAVDLVDVIVKESVASFVVDNKLPTNALAAGSITEDEHEEIHEISGRTLAEFAIANARFDEFIKDLEADEIIELKLYISNYIRHKKAHNKKWAQEIALDVFGQKFYDKLQLERLKME